MKGFLFSFVLLLLSFETAKSQIENSPIDISTIHRIQEINQCQLFVVPANGTQPGSLLDIKWTPYGNQPKIHIPSKWLNATIYLKFKLENPLDSSIKVHFLAGTYIKSTKIYQLLQNNKLVQLDDLSGQDGYQPIQIKKKGVLEFIAKIKLTKRGNNVLTPTLITDQHLTEFKILRHHYEDWRSELSYITCGLLILIVLYNGNNYLDSHSKTFLYGFFYSISMLLLQFLTVFLDGKNGALHSFFNEYLEFAIRTISIIFYVEFTRSFLETSSKLPLINRILKSGVYSFAALLVINTYVIYFTNQLDLQSAIENLQKNLMILTGILYISLAFFRKNFLVYYIAGGNLIFITFSAVAILIDEDIIINSGAILQSGIIFNFGVIGDLILFSAGIAYKNKNSLSENTKKSEDLEKQNFETRMALLHSQQNERNRISADMHDDLGAGITSIRLYSELAKKRMGKKSIPEIDKISSSANELINNMNTIIWTMSSSNDSLYNTIAYLRTYALEYFEDNSINCQINVDDTIPDSIVSGGRRRNVFLIIKETLHNIVKHSNATEVKITLSIKQGYLTLEIQDNGNGIDLHDFRKLGNGIVNMKKRAADMQVNFSIEKKHGTLVTLKYKLELGLQ